MPEIDPKTGKEVSEKHPKERLAEAEALLKAQSDTIAALKSEVEALKPKPPERDPFWDAEEAEES